MTTDITLPEYEKLSAPNWGGYGEMPITPATLELARTIARLLSEPADIAPGGDGTVCFEWVDAEKGNKVFLDIGEDEISIYARIGEKDANSPQSGKRIARTMSNLIFNLRLWYWHFQIARDAPWVSISFNRYRWGSGERSPWIELH